VKEKLIWEADNQDGFNEKLLKVMCLNQAIGKLMREINDLSTTRDKLAGIMEEGVETEKLEVMLE